SDQEDGIADVHSANSAGSNRHNSSSESHFTSLPIPIVTPSPSFSSFSDGEFMPSISPKSGSVSPSNGAPFIFAGGSPEQIPVVPGAGKQNLLSIHGNNRTHNTNYSVPLPLPYRFLSRGSGFYSSPKTYRYALSKSN